MTSAVEKIIMVINNCQAKDLNKLRYKKYLAAMKTSLKTSFNIVLLPPTSAAETNHTPRVYWIVQRWQNNVLSLVLWGCHIASQTLLLPTQHCYHLSLRIC
ncbi:hypothetical protein M0804_009019 [Polistes exclamans]|nr:hypothetical protein M0804_009019 [Polistes exclamans]